MSELKKLKDFNLQTFKGIAAIKSVDGKNHLIPSGAVFPNGIKLDKIHKVELINASHNDKKLRLKDILFNTGGEGTLGRSNYFSLDNGIFFADSFVLTIRNRDKALDELFLFYVLNNFNSKKQIENFKVGTTGITAIKESSIQEIEFYCPEDIAEQRRIASILSNLDKAIIANEQLIAKYQRIKTGLLQDLLTNGIDKNGNLRSEKTHKYKDSPLGRIPVEWKEKNISEISLNVVDCPHSTPNYIDQGVLVARTFSVKNGEYDVKGSSYLSIEDYYERIKRLIPQTGDIIFTREAPVGEAFVIPKGMKICLGQRVMLLRLKEDYIPEFLLELLYFEQTRLRFDNLVGGTTNPHLNVGDVKKLTFMFPDKNEQKRITEKINGVRNLVSNYSANLSKLQSLKTGLMQDLLSGIVRVDSLINKNESL